MSRQPKTGQARQPSIGGYFVTVYEGEGKNGNDSYTRQKRRPGSTIAKEEAREFVRTYITNHLQPLLDAQINNAEGLKHLMMRDPKTGKFERITGDAKQIDKALKSKNACWIYTKDPNVAAFTDLLNRAIDKPAEHVQVEGGGSITIRWRTDDEPKLLESKVIEIEAHDPDKKGNG
jgi:hypothetical protein